MSKYNPIRLSKGESSIHPRLRRCPHCGSNFPDRQYAKHINICRFQDAEQSEELRTVQMVMKWRGHFDPIDLETISVRDLRERVREANGFLAGCPAMFEWVNVRLSGPVTLRQKVKNLLNSDWMLPLKNDA